MEGKKKKLVKIKDLVTRSPFSDLFTIEGATLAAVKKHMKRDGYDPTQPIAVWRDGDKRLVVLDGHIRLAAARELGDLGISAVELNMKDEDEALKYSIHSQRDRRNITDADLHRCIEAVDSRRQRGGDRKSEEAKKSKVSGGHFDFSSAKQTAKDTGTSESKVKRSRTVTDHADEKTKREVLEGKKSINQAAKETKEKRKAVETAKKEEAGKKCPVAGDPKLSEEDQKREVDFWLGMEKEINAARDNFMDKVQGLAEDIASPLQVMVDEHVAEHSLPDLENLADEAVVAVCSGVRLSEGSLERPGGISVRFGLGKAEVFTGKLKLTKGNAKRFEAIEKRYNAIRSASLFNVPVKRVEQWGSEPVLVIGKRGKTKFKEAKP